MAKLFNTKTRQEEVVPEDKLNEAIASGSHSYAAADRVNVLDKDGKSWNVPATDVKQMLQEGYQVEGPTREAVREYVKENEGLKGATKVALGQFADEALMGVPEIILDKTQDPLEVAKRDAIKKEHDIANAVGGVAGFGASMLYGGPVAKGAGKVGVAALEKAVGNRLAEAGVEQGIKATAKGIAGKIAEKGAQYGAEGVALSAPKAIIEASLGDHELAAETLMYGGLAGLGLGAGGAALKELGKLSGQAAIKTMEGTSKFALSKVVGLDDTATNAIGGNFGDEVGMAAREALSKGDKKGFVNTTMKALDGVDSEHLGELANKDLAGRKKFFEDAFEHIQTQIKKAPKTEIDPLKELISFGGIEHFLPGVGGAYAVGKLGSVAYNAAKDPQKILTGILYTEKAMKVAGKALNRVDSVMTTLGNNKRIPSLGTSSVGAIGRFTGTEGTRQEQLSKLSENLAQYQNNPDYAAQQMGLVTGPLSNTGAPGVAQAYAIKNAQVAQYLADNIPKPTKISTPFNKVAWKPTDQELATFERKVHAINNPLSILDDLENNSLRKESVDAVKTIYPKLFTKIQDKITDYVIRNPSQMPYSSRLKLSMLMDLPLGDELAPESIRYLQDNFVTANEKSPKPSGKTPIMPDMATETQKLSGS